ncbi:MAG TPA: hypothetical protein VGL38_11855 [bacterium]|jgi:hypothetical protein
MKVRSRFWVILGLLCLAALTLAVQTKVTWDPNDPKHVKPSAGTALSVLQGDEALSAAHAAWARYQATGNMTPEEKELVYRFGLERSGNSLDNVGGPDGGGYRYKDNVSPDTATYNWIELTGDAQATWVSGWTSHDDGTSTSKYPIGFAFPFYGVNRDSFWVCSNGQIEFGAASASNYTSCIPQQSTWGPAILPYVWDLHLDNGGHSVGVNTVGFRNFGSYLVIEYDSVGYWSSSYAGSSLKFEVILYSNGKIKLQYNNLSLAGGAPMGTVGVQNGLASPSNSLAYRCGSSANTVMPLVNGRAIWFYQLPSLLHDYATSSVQNPLPGIPYPINSSVQIQATFTNAGSTTEASPVKYRFNNGTVVTETTPSLAQYGVDAHTFATNITMPAVAGQYTLVVWTDLPGDLDHTNDTIRVLVNATDCWDLHAGSNVVNLTGETTCGYPTRYTATCLGAYDSYADKIYRWTVTQPGQYLISVNPGTGSFYYPGILVSNHCPPDSNCIVSATSSNSGPVQTACTNFTVGTYYIMVATEFSTCIPSYSLNIMSCSRMRCCYNGGNSCVDTTQAACTALGGTWTAGMTCATNACIPGDGCAGAIPISFGAADSIFATGTTLGCDVTCTDTCAGTTQGTISSSPDLFYRLTLSSCRLVEMKLEPNDMYLVVWNNNQCCLNTQFLCDDDASYFDTTGLHWVHHRPTGLNSFVADTMPAGTYIIRVGYYSTGSGPYNLTIYSDGTCNTATCDSARDVTLYRINAAREDSCVQLTFTAPVAGSYEVWNTTDKNAAFDPHNPLPPWTLAVTLNATVGFNAWMDPSAVSLNRRYVLRHICP